MCKRSIILLITILHAAGFHAMGQDHSVVYKYYSLPVNYSYSGITNSILSGREFFVKIILVASDRM